MCNTNDLNRKPKFRAEYDCREEYSTMEQDKTSDERSSGQQPQSPTESAMPDANYQAKIAWCVRTGGIAPDKVGAVVELFSKGKVRLSQAQVDTIIQEHENDVDDAATLRQKKRSADAVILELYDMTGHNYGDRRSVTVKNLKTFLKHLGIDSAWQTRDQLIAAVASSPYLAQQYPDRIQQLNLFLKNIMGPPTEPRPRASRAGPEDTASTAKEIKQ